MNHADSGRADYIISEMHLTGCKRIQRSMNIRLKAGKSHQSITSTMVSYKGICVGHQLNWSKLWGHKQSRGLLHSPHKNLFLVYSSAQVFISQIGSKWNSSFSSWLMLLHPGVFMGCAIFPLLGKKYLLLDKMCFQSLVLSITSLLRFFLLFLCLPHDSLVSKCYWIV